MNKTERNVALGCLVTVCLLVGFWKYVQQRAYTQHIAEYRAQLAKNRPAQLRPWEEKLNLSSAQRVEFEKIFAEHDEQSIEAALEKQTNKAKTMAQNADERAIEQVHRILRPDQIVVFNELVEKSKQDAAMFQEQWKKMHPPVSSK